jgi:DNA-directed RNA polymerase subunit alpha
MPIIPLPKKVSYDNSKGSSADLVIEPLYPGFGTTLGNLLRRILLSSLSGAAVTQVKITGSGHEFSSLPHIKEDAVELILNFKKIRVKALQELTEPVIVKLNVSEEKEVTAGDIETSSEIEIINSDLKLATITDKAGKFEAELTIESGRGYVPVEMQENQTNEVGVIAIDSMYSPIVKVAMDIKNVRVDKMTNYDSLKLSIETDGTRSPEESVHEAIDIIREQIDFIYSGGQVEEAVQEEADAEETSELATEGQEAEN